MKRVEKFLKEAVCPECGRTRLSEAARAPRLRGASFDEVCRLPLSELVEWVNGVSGSLPEEMRPMADSICKFKSPNEIPFILTPPIEILPSFKSQK